MSAPAPIAQRDASCPACGYNLRGLLTAERVTCPECGATHDVDEVLNPAPIDSMRWWYAALWLPGAIVGLVAGTTSYFSLQLPYELLGLAVLIATIAWLTYLLWYPFAGWTRTAHIMLLLVRVVVFTLCNVYVAGFIAWVVNSLLWVITR